MVNFIKSLLGKDQKDNKNEANTIPFLCDHKYEYKTWLHDTKHFPYSNSPFHKEIVFRCKKCGKHRSLYGFELGNLFDDLCRQDVDKGHENFRFEIPYQSFYGNEAFEIYKRYLKEGIDLANVNFDENRI